MSSKANVKVDLAPLGKGVVECDATIDSNSMDQPETITIVVDGLEAQQINYLCKGSLVITDVFGNDRVLGVLDGGDSFDGQLAFIKNVIFGHRQALLGCYLGAVTRTHGQPSKEKGQWVFGL